MPEALVPIEHQAIEFQRCGDGDFVGKQFAGKLMLFLYLPLRPALWTVELSDVTAFIIIN